MRWLNTGFVEGFNLFSGAVTTKSTNIQYTNTGSYVKVRNGYVRRSFEDKNEVWVSFDLCLLENNATYITMGFLGSNSSLPILYEYLRDGIVNFKVIKGNDTKSILYDPLISFNLSDWKKHNIEIHMVTGDTGRIDVWLDHKLMFSYRSPSAFQGTINSFYFHHNYTYSGDIALSSFILQDTRRIGYEKFVKLNIDPAAEQNMPQGSTTTYTLSGLSDSSEYSDITGVCAVLQATSRDANINTGTFTLEGADVGTIDVSDSSGRAYEIAHAETNSITGLPFTRDEIEGKTLSFTVNGAE